MSQAYDPHIKNLNRRTWSLWALAFAVIFALTATVPFLYVPLLELIGADEDGLWIRNGATAGWALAGLVSIFCFYVIVKQRELNRVRHVLQSDELELQDARTRLSEISALFQLSTTLNLQLQLDAILEIIVRRVTATLKAQQASVMIYNPESGQLEVRAAYGLESEFARNAKAPLGKGIAGWVAQRKLSVLLGPEPPNEELAQYYKHNRKITSALSLPLSVGDRCLGVLNVNRINNPDQFSEHHRDMLRLFAEHVGAIIDRADGMDRLAARAHALESTNLKLAEMNRMKDVFLSTASHELKTPLTSVIGYSELLEEQGDALSAQQRSVFLGRLQGEARRLLALIDDILDLSRLETGKMALHRQALSINRLCESAIETAQPMGDKHSVRLGSHLDETIGEIDADEVKLRQVVVNLLVNAIKFSPQGESVDISTRRDGDDLVIEVKDQGPGVRPEEATHIFELFGQGLRQHDSKARGLGLGLHLAKRISEMHGGHVGVNSVFGKGSTFWIRLPVASAPGESETQAA